MGWTFTHREKGQSNLDWFQEEWPSVEILDMATKRGVAYAACKPKEGPVFAMVILTRWVPKDYFNFGYKDLDESMGPCEDDCPERIFKLLGPLPEDEADPAGERNWAAQWRQRVQARLDLPKVRKGMRIRFTPDTWTGGPYGIVKYLGKRNLFLTDRGMVRFRGWQGMNYEVVN